EEHQGEAREGPGNAELQARLALDRVRGTAAATAESAERAEQSEVDRDHDDESGEEADPNERVYLAGARRVRRQGGAILITASGADAVRPALAEPTPTYTRRPYEEALAATPRGKTGGTSGSDGRGGRGDRPAAG